MNARVGTLLLWFASFSVCFGQRQASISIDAQKREKKVSPTLHGIFFEEISHGGEGGLYGELIQNRGFEEVRIPKGTTLQNGFLVPNPAPHYNLPNGQASDWKMPWALKSDWPAWSAQTSGGATVTLALTQEKPLNEATPNSLKITVSGLEKSGQASLVNEGFWGIKVDQGKAYKLNFYARSEKKYKGPLTVALQSEDGKILASHVFNNPLKAGDWQKLSCDLVVKASDPKAKFVISFGSTGTLFLDFVSLFPAETFKNRENGLRPDLAQYLADLKPSFIRWPGGCFVEGITVESAPNWKQSIGPVEKRPGTFSPWGYWSSDGLGYHEFLQFCEDTGAGAMYVFNAGVACEFRSGTFLPDAQLPVVIADVLDAIEYAVGPADSKWGKVRVANGHPAPFPLKYVEVGNEQHGPWYANRFNLFYDAIKAKYPDLKVIASMGIADVNRHTLDGMKKLDIADEHAYKSAYWAMNNYDHFDKYKRGDWELYVGEYATNAGVGSGNMLAALNDAVYILAMERNGDLVTMSSYAPLLVNTNDVDWPVNLINFNNSQSFARISYYAIQMLNKHRADQNLATTVQVQPAQITKPAFAGGIGLSTWDTQTEYKDIQVIQKGKVVYSSNFEKAEGEWEKVRGTWGVKEGAMGQTAEGAQLFAMLKDKSYDTYTLKLKGRKLSGYNAFIIPFAVKDGGKTQVRAHIGSYWNQYGVFEQVTEGTEVANLSSSTKLPENIETGKWYDIRLEVGLNKVDCYLNDQFLMSYTIPDMFYSISGVDEKTGDIIVKVVNGSPETFQTNLNLKGATNLSPVGEVVTLSAENYQAENSFETPTKYVPQTSRLTNVTSSFKVGVKPYSISVYRLKTKK
ncbi:alpha-L-arabinofuranosidase C-terminal domain-containing protein [Rufibacter roseolus]|uniref:alpha-L-arabinofuranosidase C-terminal domain-containing protein n=1 Tax=Rufibacter roseolus TaxID=2817375 RepID=UPI001B309E4D|nr:alpha-L-arabinofuranosidase C-terminal domain-containing protein [Rufibacter roseolus]